MNRNAILALTGLFIALVAAQVLVLRNLSLYNTAFCFAYVMFVLMLPVDLSRLLVLVMAFVLGLAIDVFEDTLGINAAATVLVAFLRPQVLKLLDNQSGLFQESVPISIGMVGWRVFAIYTFSLVFVHNIIFFLIEAASTNLFLHTLTKGIVSALYTMTVVMLLQLIFFSKKRSR